MSDDNRQVYDEVIRSALEKLEMLTGDSFHGYRSEVWNVIANVIAQVTHTSQSDGQTIEQRVTALEERLNAQPYEQPSETCKWKVGQIEKSYFFDPHTAERWANWIVKKHFQYCPTCGLRIEVVE